MRIWVAHHALLVCVGAAGTLVELVVFFFKEVVQ